MPGKVLCAKYTPTRPDTSLRKCCTLARKRYGALPGPGVYSIRHNPQVLTVIVPSAPASTAVFFAPYQIRNGRRRPSGVKRSCDTSRDSSALPPGGGGVQGG